MKRNLPNELHEKLNEKYKYLFSTEYLQKKSFKEQFFDIIQDVFVMYIHMAIRCQIVSDAVINIEKNPKIYNANKDKYNSFLMCLDDIIDASNFISYELYKITSLFK